ncbi:GIY-YIG nuclease family protein [Acetobacterium sp. KB-1]|uniref:GIY-YIG nuclease family protein n=1 Tax=Acetobacterium sp. KB-1 TaxID=2184575 RepID=UPI0013A6926A|nr:GIY-YIG nuclease family protein [Acetobacterium sp. KB-1]
MKELIPKDEYGIFADKSPTKMIAPKQWIYIIEKEQNRVKVGVSVMPEERIKVLERAGGFKILRKRLLGPFQNSYQVECEVHRRMRCEKIISEWFSIPFETAVVVAEEVAESRGDINSKQQSESPDMAELISCFCPQYTELFEFYEALNDADIAIYKDENGKIWFESEDFGMFTAEFLNAFMKINKTRLEEDK